MRFFNLGHFNEELDGGTVQISGTIFLREGEIERLRFTSLHAGNRRIKLGEHTAAADDELEAFSLAAREFNAFLRAGEVHRNAVVLLSSAVSSGFSVGDALLAHDVDRFFDSSIINRGGVTLEVQRLEIGICDFRENFKRSREAHRFFVAIGAFDSFNLRRAGDLQTGGLSSLRPGLTDEFVEGLVKGAHAVHGFDLLHRNMALAEAGHTGILGVAAQMLLSKLADLSGRNGELKRTLERHGRGLFLLGFRSSSLFDGLFSLFFSHRFDLYVISIRFAPKNYFWCRRGSMCE